jgi:hypothetical protein
MAQSTHINPEHPEETYELLAIIDHKTIKGIKGWQYRCVWAKHGATWEMEKTIKPHVEKLISQYWLNIGKNDHHIRYAQYFESKEEKKENEISITISMT